MSYIKFTSINLRNYFVHSLRTKILEEITNSGNIFISIYEIILILNCVQYISKLLFFGMKFFHRVPRDNIIIADKKREKKLMIKFVKCLFNSGNNFIKL